jgi:hypothetical protein
MWWALCLRGAWLSAGGKGAQAAVAANAGSTGTLTSDSTAERVAHLSS